MALVASAAVAAAAVVGLIRLAILARVAREVPAAPRAPTAVAARVAMEDWRVVHGPMSALQALTFAVEVLSSDNVRGWTNELDAVRLNVISLARHVVAAHQPTSGGRNGAGGVQ